MKRILLALIFTLMLLIPSGTGGTPISPEVTPENGCVFADAVLREVMDEEKRLHIDLVKASMARKVVLTVQVRSGEKLRKVTNTWMNEHCLKQSVTF